MPADARRIESILDVIRSDLVELSNHALGKIGVALRGALGGVTDHSLAQLGRVVLLGPLLEGFKRQAGCLLNRVVSLCRHLANEAINERADVCRVLAGL